MGSRDTVHFCLREVKSKQPWHANLLLGKCRSKLLVQQIDEYNFVGSSSNFTRWHSGLASLSALSWDRFQQHWTAGISEKILMHSAQGQTDHELRWRCYFGQQIQNKAAAIFSKLFSKASCLYHQKWAAEGPGQGCHVLHFALMKHFSSIPITTWILSQAE